MARISGSQLEDESSILSLGTNERTSMKFKKRNYENYIICVKMFTRPTKENLEIIPKEQYQPRRYRYFGSANTYEKAFQLREDA